MILNLIGNNIINLNLTCLNWNHLIGTTGTYVTMHSSWLWTERTGAAGANEFDI